MLYGGPDSDLSQAASKRKQPTDCFVSSNRQNLGKLPNLNQMANMNAALLALGLSACGGGGGGGGSSVSPPQETPEDDPVITEEDEENPIITEVLDPHQNIVGGDDAETITTGGGDDIVNAGDGDDTVDAGDGDDVVAANIGDDIVSGEGGNDIIRGQRGNDILRGGDGRDGIVGQNGNDVLLASAGDDILFDVKGQNLAEGGEDDDVFSLSVAGKSLMVITDFERGSDKIRLFDQDKEFTLEQNTERQQPNEETFNTVFSFKEEHYQHSRAISTILANAEAAGFTLNANDPKELDTVVSIGKNIRMVLEDVTGITISDFEILLSDHREEDGEEYGIPRISAEIL